MADPVLKRVTRYANNGQISHSTSSLTPVNHVLTDTSNLTKKSKSLDKDENPVKQIEPTADVKQIELTTDVKQIEPTADVKQIEPTADVKQESSIPSNEQKKDYEIGDIVWAKIGKYPFWPSIVCVDPETNLYIKGSLNEKKTFSLHVRFCNDNGRRSWAKTIENYLGKEDLLSKYPNCLGFIKSSKKQMSVWDLAVKEADGWLKTNREDRVAKFTRTNGLISSKISGLGPTPSTSKSSVVQKRVASASSSYVNLNGRDYLRKLMAECVEGSSVTYETDRETSTSEATTQQSFVDLKNISNEQPKKKAVKRKFVDEKKKQIREALKIKKAKKALQVKKYGFSYSSSEYESSDDEASPLVPFSPTRTVLARIKSSVKSLEFKSMQETTEKRVLIKAIRFAERNAKKKQREQEEEDDDEEDEDDDDDEEEDEEEEEEEQD